MQVIRNVAIIICILACDLQAQTVVVNDNLRIGGSDFTDADFNIGVDQDAAKTTYTGAYFDYTGTRVSYNTTLLDEGVDVYVVKPGDVFSPAAIKNNQFTPILTFGPVSYPSAFVGSGDFYLGVSTGIGYSDSPFRGNRTAFGWVHLHPVNGVLTMVSNVMSYNSPGIIVGTTTLVPEPGAVGLIAMALTAFAFPIRPR